MALGQSKAGRETGRETMNLDIDEASWSARGVTFEKYGDTYRFVVPGHNGPITVRSANGKLFLAKDRSSGHRALLTALGLDA